MKMIEAHFTALQSGIEDALRAADISMLAIKCERDMWDVYHFAVSRSLVDHKTLYRDYNDSHIETALRRIFRQC